PGLDRGETNLFGIVLARVGGDHSLALEHPPHRVGFSEVATELREPMPDRGGRAVAVVGERVDHYCDSGGPVSLVANLFQLLARPLAGGALDRVLYLVGGHVYLACLLHSESQAKVAVDVASPLFGGDQDL